MKLKQISENLFLTTKINKWNKKDEKLAERTQNINSISPRFFGQIELNGEYSHFKLLTHQSVANQR